MKDLSFRTLLQELSEVRMVHLNAGDSEYRIRTELSPTANAIFRAPRRQFPVAQTPSINREQLLAM